MELQECKHDKTDSQGPTLQHTLELINVAGAMLLYSRGEVQLPWYTYSRVDSDLILAVCYQSVAAASVAGNRGPSLHCHYLSRQLLGPS